MFDALKARTRNVFRRDDKTLVLIKEVDISPVDEESLWIDVAKQVTTCMIDGGFYYEIKKTLSPSMDVMLGYFCEVALIDKVGVNYEATMQSYHYLGDKGESKRFQIFHQGDKDHVFVSVSFRSNVNKIRLTPDSEVIKHRSISSYPKRLDLNERIQLLGELNNVTVDEEKTLELFNERQRCGRHVAWIRETQLVSGYLE